VAISRDASASGIPGSTSRSRSGRSNTHGSVTRAHRSADLDPSWENGNPGESAHRAQAIGCARLTWILSIELSINAGAVRVSGASATKPRQVKSQVAYP
jgi:hypothetical protein